MYFCFGEPAVWSNCRRLDRGGVSRAIYLACLWCTVTHPGFHGGSYSLSSSLYSQLLSLPPSFFPYIQAYPSSLLPSSCPGDSLWHWQKDLSRLPLNAGRDVYHGSAIPLSPLSIGLQCSAWTGVCLCLYFKVWRLRDRKPASLLPSPVF